MISLVDGDHHSFMAPSFSGMGVYPDGTGKEITYDCCEYEERFQWKTHSDFEIQMKFLWDEEDGKNNERWIRVCYDFKIIPAWVPTVGLCQIVNGELINFCGATTSLEFKADLKDA